MDPTAGPLEEFAHDLRRLRRQAGNPSYRTMAKSAHYSVATLSEAARGLHKPSLQVTLAYVAACGGDLEQWKRRWYRVSGELEARDAPARGHPGSPVRAPVQSRPGRRRTPQGAPDRDTGARASRALTNGPGADVLTADERAELHRLRSEVEELRQANEVLKAASAIFAADLRTTSQVVYNSAGRQDRSV
ncbi:helix-turn-helix domain-containing protein [Streptomyces formicae]|uniref:helix-turn-helix domain-containing protein n=1 Tax=Streptomyces formicae TaxID=1616117 RepID=UPI001F57530C|nr:helix-turn-helix transcriptional regulator [Streptomyces formicae]